MQRLSEFIGHHPYLAAGAALAIIAVLVYELRAKLQSFAAVSAMQAVRLMNQGALVIDLRGREQFDSGHIGDARNIPQADLEKEADALKKWRDKTVITYGSDGSDGANAARVLTRLGFTKVVNLDGGLNGWLKDNMPIAKPTGGNKQSAK
ncbi:MAG: rhodanese-like domain-containing protein [Steroidobacteraceae bacterium]|jgi:rhodanese-related sulfurtransferase